MNRDTRETCNRDRKRPAETLRDRPEIVQQRHRRDRERPSAEAGERPTETQGDRPKLRDTTSETRRNREKGRLQGEPEDNDKMPNLRLRLNGRKLSMCVELVDRQKDRDRKS